MLGIVLFPVELCKSVHQVRETNVSATLGEIEREDPLLDIVGRHKSGEAVGLTSICSAHPLVLEAAIAQAAQDGDAVLIEATSNQVDQSGGYTGMRPADFRDRVMTIAACSGVAPDRIVLGGDHLGPNRWRHLPPDEAMAYADELVRAYVVAGFTKIHLDCSFPCAGERARLTDEVVSARAARLVAVAQDTAEQIGRGARLRYVIGTEVPSPGGERDTGSSALPTSAASARRCLAAHRAAFAQHGVGDVWPRVIALVVQPGVEFDQFRVLDYIRDRTVRLRAVLDGEPGMVFEAHSTDYQTRASLRALVEDHWAILKVGPGLTFALREALFALAAIESELVGEDERSRLPEVIEERMLAQPRHWNDYYRGDPIRRRLARRYSYSDRLRYYWADPAVSEAQERLLENLRGATIPLALLSQHLPAQHARVRGGELRIDPKALVLDHVRDVLRDYAYACGGE
jgi:D-tagatose-1,6-bisphosphate aldolase subunit GatZ/KbaZ